MAQTTIRLYASSLVKELLLFVNGTEQINLTDEQAFKNLFDRYYIPLCVFAERYVGDEALASDAVQECFTRLWLKQHDFRYVHQVKSFLYISVRNNCLNELEHKEVVSGYKKTLLDKEDETTFRDSLIEAEMHRIVTEAVEKLPPQTRTIIRLALDGHSNGEIAEKLAVSKETVHTLKKNAYKKLRSCLKEYYYIVLLLPLIP